MSIYDTINLVIPSYLGCDHTCGAFLLGQITTEWAGLGYQLIIYLKQNNMMTIDKFEL